MRHYCLSLLAASSLMAILATQPAAAFTQLCPGAALAGVSGPITNGSSCNLEATGTTVTELFAGVSAKDTDILNLGSTEIFNNQTATTSPVDVASQSVTKGATLGFNLVNTNDLLNFFLGEPTFDAGTAYTNPANPPFVSQSALPGVYHFAWFNITNASDFDSLFGPKVDMPTGVGSVDAYIMSHGGYSDWTFVGVEDSRVTADDDWNDTIYAFQGVAPVGTNLGGGGSTVPEPSTWVMMIAGFAGLGLAGYRASRKSAVAV
jgi:PEP-CTERM motif